LLQQRGRFSEEEVDLAQLDGVRSGCCRLTPYLHTIAREEDLAAVTPELKSVPLCVSEREKTRVYFGEEVLAEKAAQHLVVGVGPDPPDEARAIEEANGGSAGTKLSEADFEGDLP